jgi:hypothetical protein
LESLSREELIKLVQKQWIAAKEEEAKESAKIKKQQEANSEIASNEEVKRAYLASQQKVEELTEELAKLHMEYQKQLKVINLALKTGQRKKTVLNSAAFQHIEQNTI